MALALPRKFTLGQKVGIADVYGELHVWPDGHFHYMISIRNSSPGDRCEVNASFVLFGADAAPLGTFGMQVGDGLPISPWGRVHHELYGKVPADKLASTEGVALAFRTSDQRPETSRLGKIIGIGQALVLCPTPA